jgi:hypothetical protein
MCGNGQGPRLELSQAAERMLLVDQDDRLFYRVDAADGRMLGGDPRWPPPGAPRDHVGRVFATPCCRVSRCAWSPHGCPTTQPQPRRPGAGAGGRNPQHRRKRLAWEILARRWCRNCC